MTFTDSANHQAVVDIAGNGNYSADLSSLTDGTVTSSLSVVTLAAITTSVAGNAVSLDTDNSLNPSLMVSDPPILPTSLSPSFGLESDSQRQWLHVLPNTAGKADVVPIGVNGTYSADLSNLSRTALSRI